MGHMIGLPTIKFLSAEHNPINYAICLLILTITFFGYGYDILKNGYKNLIHRIPNMDTLVAIGVVSSFIYSLYGMYMIIKGHSTDVIISIAILVVTIIIIANVAIKIYSNAILNYGTKMSIKDIIKMYKEKQS